MDLAQAFLPPAAARGRRQSSPRSNCSGGLENLQIFGKEPMKSPRSDIAEGDSQEPVGHGTLPLQALPASVPAQAVPAQAVPARAVVEPQQSPAAQPSVPATTLPVAAGGFQTQAATNADQYNPGEDAQIFHNAKESRKRNREQDAGEQKNPKAKAGGPKAKSKSQAKAKPKNQPKKKCAKTKASVKPEDVKEEAEAETKEETKETEAERPPMMIDGAPTVFYKTGKINRNSNLHCLD